MAMPGEGPKKKHEHSKESRVPSAGARARPRGVPASRRDLPAARRKSDGERAGGGPPSQPETVPPMIPWFCVHCGAQGDGDADTCWNCGAARGD
jgi:hypothetical protein